MPNEPESIGEIARLLKAFQAHTDRQFETMNTRLDRLVSAEVHQIHANNTDRRIDELRQLLADETAARIKADTAEESNRKEAAGNIRRWVQGLAFTAFAAVATLLTTLIANANG